MKVIGIDPAPAKGLAIFDGSYRHVAIHASRSFMGEIAKESDILLCWDAPLTGPPLPALLGQEVFGSAFSQRPIEKFFSRQTTGFKTPRGISVLGYSGCPHWALSRSLLGLPKAGPYDADAIPFKLITSEANRPNGGCNVVEVHPALALWLWCKAEGHNGPWEYKKDSAVRKQLWSVLMAIPEYASSLDDSCDTPKSDDELDAQIAFVLGKLWVNSSASVTLLGDQELGTFLLPRVTDLEESFARSIRLLRN